MARTKKQEAAQLNGITYHGRTYYLTRGTYYLTSRAEPGHPRQLHRAIWQDQYGPIPQGYEIHHVNHNTLDNRIENLQCLTREEHAQRRKDRRITEATSRLMQCRECGVNFCTALPRRKWCGQNCINRDASRRAYAMQKHDPMYLAEKATVQRASYQRHRQSLKPYKPRKIIL